KRPRATPGSRLTPVLAFGAGRNVAAARPGHARRAPSGSERALGRLVSRRLGGHRRVLGGLRVDEDVAPGAEFLRHLRTVSGTSAQRSGSLCFVNRKRSRLAAGLLSADNPAHPQLIWW